MHRCHPAVTATVAATVTQRWPDHGPGWARHVESEFTELCATLEATPLAQLPSKHGFVVTVASPAGRRVLRSSPDPDGTRQAWTARAMAQLAVAPAIHDVLPTEHGTWTVMNEVLPGTRLSDLDLTPEHVSAIGRALGRLRGRAGPPTAPTIADWLRTRLVDDQLSELPDGIHTAPRAERDEALTLLDGLGAELGRPELCHGDLNFGNVLLGSHGKVMLVDPRGVSGEVEYDVAVAALWLLFRGMPTGAVGALTQEVGVDRARVEAWMAVAAAARATRAAGAFASDRGR